MPKHTERRTLAYSPEQLFNLVSDIEQYPDFLPWCLDLRVRKREDNVIWADMTVGFKMIRERFTSKVTLTPNTRIDVAYSDGPFKYLINHWIFEDDGKGGTTIDFFVDFEFRSLFLGKIMGAFFGEAVRIMVTSFEKRAAVLYGQTQAAKPTSSLRNPQIRRRPKP